MHAISHDMKENSIKFRTYIGIGQTFGLPIGFFWLLIFLGSMFSYDHPGLGILADVLAFVCFLIQVSMMKYAQLRYGKMNFLQRWSMGLHIGAHAALVTTAGQYLYFRFFDNGHLNTMLNKMTSSPEFKQAFEQAMPGANIQEFIDTMTNTSLGDLTLSLLTFNLFLGLLISIISAMFSYIKLQPNNESHSTTNNQEQHTEEE